MKRVYLEDRWPQSWKDSYVYDLEEIYGEYRNLGYAYAYANRKARTLEFLKEALPEGGTVLDIAGAQGNFSLAMAENGYRVTWNDLREDLADYVRQKYESGELKFAPGNAFDLEFSEPFDAVLITEVIEHVAHPDEFLIKTSKLVKPGGYIIMTTPNGKYFRNTLPKFSDCPDPGAFEFKQFGPNSNDHIFLLHREEIEDFAKQASLLIDRIEIFNNPLTSGHIKLSKVLKILPRCAVDSVEQLTSRLPEHLKARFGAQIAVRFRLI